MLRAVSAGSLTAVAAATAAAPACQLPFSTPNWNDAVPATSC